MSSIRFYCVILVVANFAVACAPESGEPQSAEHISAFAIPQCEAEGTCDPGSGGGNEKPTVMPYGFGLAIKNNTSEPRWCTLRYALYAGVVGGPLGSEVVLFDGALAAGQTASFPKIAESDYPIPVRVTGGCYTPAADVWDIYAKDYAGDTRMFCTFYTNYSQYSTGTYIGCQPF